MNTSTFRFLSCRYALTMATCLFAATAVQAVPINTLFNTGTMGLTTGTQTLLPAFAADPHYNLIVAPSPIPLNSEVVTGPGYPFPAWVANSATSQWIGPNTNFANGPGGAYVYRTRFFLPSNADPNSVIISGLWATDNPGTDIRVNNQSGFATPSTNVIQFSALTPFSLAPTFSSTPFVPGVLNSIDFHLSNVTGPTGLRVEGLRGSFRIVPEPSLCGWAIALPLVVGPLRRRISCTFLA